MRRFLLRLTLFVPFVLAMAAINRSVDPARLFGRTAGRALDGYEDLILVDLRAGRPHPIEDEYSRRLVFEELVRDRTSIDVLVLGSSICTPFHSENFPGQTMVNGAVPGGDLEEAMCMYELACEEGRRRSGSFSKCTAGAPCSARETGCLSRISTRFGNAS